MKLTAEQIDSMRPGEITYVPPTLDPEGLRLLREARRGHYYCEDSWYSCPKAEDGCADESQGTECNCGADEWNAKIDAYLAKPRQAQEPVAWASMLNGNVMQATHQQYRAESWKKHGGDVVPLYAAPVAPAQQMTEADLEDAMSTAAAARHAALCGDWDDVKTQAASLRAHLMQFVVSGG